MEAEKKSIGLRRGEMERQRSEKEGNLVDKHSLYIIIYMCWATIRYKYTSNVFIFRCVSTDRDKLLQIIRSFYFFLLLLLSFSLVFSIYLNEWIQWHSGLFDVFKCLIYVYFLVFQFFFFLPLIFFSLSIMINIQ